MRWVRVILILVLLWGFSLLGVSQSWAKLGVGVNLGKIEVNKPLKPGGIYLLPKIAVINTGDETSDYGVSVSYHYKQKEFQPPVKWFSFSPKDFKLKPGQAQEVRIRLNLPVSARPGNYFAYIEGHPLVKKKGVTLGIAAASKLYFKVEPANIFWALLYKILTFLEITAPYSYIALSAVGVLGLILIFYRFFRISLRVQRRR